LLAPVRVRGAAESGGLAYVLSCGYARRWRRLGSTLVSVMERGGNEGESGREPPSVIPQDSPPKTVPTTQHTAAQRTCTDSRQRAHDSDSILYLLHTRITQAVGGGKRTCCAVLGGPRHTLNTTPLPRVGRVGSQNSPGPWPEARAVPVKANRTQHGSANLADFPGALLKLYA
jgi:hypothetical protein